MLNDRYIYSKFDKYIFSNVLIGRNEKQDGCPKLSIFEEAGIWIIKKCMFTGLFFGGVVEGLQVLNNYRCVFNNVLFNMAEDYVQENVEINQI